MVKVKVKGKEFYINDILKENLDAARRSVKKAWDCVLVIDGPEGVAKSTLAKMVAFYLTQGNFSHKDIVFSPDDFMTAVDKAKPETAIVLDEFVLMGMSADGASSMQKALVKKFTLIRKKRLFIILVIPYIFMLKKYFIVSRAKFLLHCYTPDWERRGYFRFYNYSEKNYLYISGSKFWNYPTKCGSSFKGTFPDYTGLFVDEDKYEAAKDEATRRLTDKDTPNKFEMTKTGVEYFIQMSPSATWPHQSKERKYMARIQSDFRKKLESAQAQQSNVLKAE